MLGVERNIDNIYTSVDIIRKAVDESILLWLELSKMAVQGKKPDKEEVLKKLNLQIAGKLKNNCVFCQMFSGDCRHCPLEDCGEDSMYYEAMYGHLEDCIGILDELNVAKTAIFNRLIYNKLQVLKAVDWQRDTWVIAAEDKEIKGRRMFYVGRFYLVKLDGTITDHPSIEQTVKVAFNDNKAVEWLKSVMEEYKKAGEME